MCTVVIIITEVEFLSCRINGLLSRLNDYTKWYTASKARPKYQLPGFETKIVESDRQRVF